MPRLLAIILLLAPVVACGRTSSEPSPTANAVDAAADTRVRALADAYLDGYFNQFPEQATYFGVPGKRHDRLTDNSLAALERWQAQEDRWRADVDAIDPATIESRPLRATHAIL